MDVKGSAMTEWPSPGLSVWRTDSGVDSVAFSQDGTRIVSGSDDGMIHVLDAWSGDTVAGPFQGHTGFVTSVRFSQDGTRIVSGSGDGTIRVWDARSGDAVAGPFQGHKIGRAHV